MISIGYRRFRSCCAWLLVAGAGVAGAAEEAGNQGPVRVIHVPETVRHEMREQIKQELLAQAKAERWLGDGSLPDWLARLRIDGDFRLRGEAVRPASGNTSPGTGFETGDLTRAADIARNSSNVIPSFNTQEDYTRTRVRLRLGFTSAVSDGVTVATRLSTGNTSDRTSTNQTLGQGFNKYSVVFDHAYLNLRSASGAWSASGGRMPNPFFATDLVWADDLGFEGLATTARQAAGGFGGFLTAGYFPLNENRPNATRTRHLVGVQGGVDRKGENHRLRFAVAVYDFKGVAGRKESALDQYTAPDYAIRSEYPVGLRQRGNTLFNVRAGGDPGAPVYGLASEFRELNLTLALDLDRGLPIPLRLSGDYVKNLQFDTEKMSRRAGAVVTDGQGQGFLVRAVFGRPELSEARQWNAVLAYRRLGSDAVLDAFVNSDFGLGGTNHKGYLLGFAYGLAKNTALALRWMSSDALDSPAPGAEPPARWSVDTLQLDLNTRF